MTPLVIALLVLVSVFGAAMLSMRMAVALPKDHVSEESKETVKLAMGLVSTLTALVLGLLIASAKGAYDANKSELTEMAAKIAFLDRVLAVYGPEAASARQSLRQTVEQMVARFWPASHSQSAQLDPDVISAGVAFRAIQELTPENDDQRALKNIARRGVAELGQMRWLLFELGGPSTSMLTMTIVVCWIAILFFSFGLFAPSNGTVIVSLMVAALSVAGSVYLILELDHPFAGFVQISSQPMLSALDHMGK